jgi:hypothetical protein
VVFKQKDAHGEYSLVVYAREGDLRINAETELLQVHLCIGDSIAADGSRCKFQERIWQLPLPEQFFE